MTGRDPAFVRLPPRGSGRVELRRPVLSGKKPDLEPPDIGYIFDANTRQLVGVYGTNPTEDHIWFLLEVEGSPEIKVDLPPGTRTKKAINLTSPVRTRTVTRPVTERRPVAETVEVLPIRRVVTERQFTNPERNSPVVLSVTRTEVTGGTSHNIAMPATVDAGDLLANVMTWNGDGDATSNGVPTGWAERGQAQDAPFGYIALLVKDAVGDEDGANVNFTTSPAAPVIGHVFRYEAGTWDDSGTASDATAFGGSATGNSSSPNPGSLSPGWGTVAASWIAIAQSTGDNTFSAVPSGYTDAGQNQFDASEGELALNTAYRTNEASSENPGAFTMQSFFWLAAAAAVKPSAATAVEITASPATVSASAVAAVPDPTATEVTASPASAVASAIAAVPVRDATVITASPAIATATAIGAAVDAPVIITASPATATSSAIAPVLDLTALVITASSASAQASAVAPTISLTALAIVASPATGTASAIAPVVLHPVTVEASPATATATAIAPSLILGAVQAEPASAVVEAMPAVLVLGEITITASPATVSAKAMSGVKLFNRREIPGHLRRAFTGNRPRRQGYKRPPSWR